MQMTEQESKKLGKLIKSIAEGNSSAIEEIYDAMKQVMYAVAYGSVDDEADAEDIVHESLWKIVTRANQFTKNKNACAWITTIVKNTAVDYVRAQAKFKMNYVSKEDAVVELDDGDFVAREIFDLLDSEEKDLVVFHFYLNMSYSQIARVMHISKSTVKYRIDKIIENVKNFYEN